jgi:hypothetical protein
MVQRQARGLSVTGSGMKSFYAMRRANGDWFAVDDNGHVRMPIFKSSGDAMIARSRDNGMECFRPVAFDACALEQLRKTDGNTASFLIVADPSRKLKYGLRAAFTELASLMVDLQRVDPKNENSYSHSNG